MLLAPMSVLHRRYGGEHGNLRGAVRRLGQAGLLRAGQPLMEGGGRGGRRGGLRGQRAGGRRRRGLLMVLHFRQGLLQLTLEPLVVLLCSAGKVGTRILTC